MNIIVLAAAGRVGGALTIYNQFISHLKDDVEIHPDNWIVFVSSNMPQPQIKNVRYVVDDNHSILHRIWFDNFGLKKWLKKEGILIDGLLSFQNMGARVDCPQMVYYHQSVPLYPHKWNFFNKSERRLCFLKYIYPFFVRSLIKKDTSIAVQIPFIKDRFRDFYDHPEEKIFVCFPDIERIQIDSIQPFAFTPGTYNFLFPAGFASYKNHVTLVKAVAKLKDEIDKGLQIRIHLTISKGDNVEFDRLLHYYHLESIFVFQGLVKHEQLLSMYKSSCGLLMPSDLETLGLPLLEAASFGLPIIAADAEYAHQVIGGYSGSVFKNVHDYDGWALEIMRIAKSSQKFPLYVVKKSDWPVLFENMHKMIK